MKPSTTFSPSACWAAASGKAAGGGDDGADDDGDAAAGGGACGAGAHARTKMGRAATRRGRRIGRP